MPADEHLIRAARSRSDAAIEHRDLDAIAAVWTGAIHVTGSMGLQLSGVDAGRACCARHPLPERP